MLVGQPNRATVPLGVVKSSAVLYIVVLASEPQSPNLHSELARHRQALEESAASAAVLPSEDSTYSCRKIDVANHPSESFATMPKVAVMSPLSVSPRRQWFPVTPVTLVVCNQQPNRMSGVRLPECILHNDS